ncbi:Retrovirus-related Pol polyprotein from transposon RE1 [Vitis vinifera]|uniref:Retrovirus-related Pol polyprotein from transposon RE1 n=1 Tax=Vitis vinifera TaxID=29760 RepID=A0A438IMS8_VITVI|nr:Retrovirus-related Pol polyprotein from transposon RE1 [Vitis vinifera]
MSEKNTIVFQSEGTFNPGIILTESNYDVWSQLMEMHIVEREKLSYIRGKTNLPKESEDGYEKWYAENQKVKRWLLMSLCPEIIKRYLRLPTTQEFGVHYQRPSMMEKSIERQRVHIFLVGLSGDFEQVRGEILRKDPLPDLEECYALIQREAIRHASMKEESDNPDTSAMVVRQQSTRNWQDQSKTNHPKADPNIDKSTFKCTHCNKTGHTKSRCFEIVRYPDWWDHNRDQRKKDFKKTSTAAVAEIKIEANVDEKASALVAATDYGVIMVENIRVSDLQKYLEGHGIIHQTTSSNTPQQNGVAKRKNRHLLEVVRASLIATKIPISYWGETITSVAYMINRGEYHKEIQTLNYDYHIFEEKESGQSELVNQEAVIPNSVQEALVDPRWKAAMNEEMKSLQKNETWELVECPPGKKPVGCRWIYTVKYKADGSIERFKARLVAKGYTQTYGIDYTETFAPVAKINTVRVLLSLAANLDWPLQQFDVKKCLSACYRNDPEERKTLQNYLSREFEMKDLGPLKYFLGIEVSRSSEEIFMSQRKYALDLLQETGMSGCQPINTPTEEGLKLCVESNQVSTDKGRYQRLVGRLMYLAHTRPDLAYALSVVSQYMHNPREQHMNAVMRILRYLKNAPGKGILFAKNVDHQSGNLMTWKSKKQNVVARSSVEAEFRGMSLGLCEALWLRLLLQDLGYLSRQSIQLFCDTALLII